MSFLVIFLIVMSVLIFIGVTVSGCAAIAYVKMIKENVNNVSSIAMPGGVIAKEGLKKHNLDIQVVKVEGSDIAHYDTQNKIIALSPEFYNNSSIIAEAVALHECGHAVQDHNNADTIKKFKKFATVSKILTPLFWISFIVGVILTFTLEPEFFFIATIIYGLSALVLLLEFSFKLTTMSMEKQASKIGLEILKSYNITKTEEKMVKSAYRTALATYFATIFNPVVYIFKGITWLIYNTIGKLFR